MTKTSWPERRGGPDQNAADARNAEIVGKPCRIQPLSEDALTPDARAVVKRMRDAIGLETTAQLPDYCLTMLRRLEFFNAHLDISTVIFRGRVPARVRELAVLRIGWLLGSPYEWGEHVDISKRHGVTPEEIERVTEGASAPGWSTQDAAILRAVEEILETKSVSDECWAMLAAFWDQDTLMDFAFMVGQYVANGLVLNILRLPLEKGNAGLTQR